jgi:hypothetical protein
MLTVADVKRDLPQVKIRYGGKLYWGRVTGRLNQFATVSPFSLIDGRKLVTTIMVPCIPFAWETVTRAVNSGAILQSDCD